MYSGEYDACDVTLSVYPHRASLKNMPDHGGNRTYDQVDEDAKTRAQQKEIEEITSTEEQSDLKRTTTSREAVYTFLLPYKELGAIYYYVLDIILTFDFAADITV
jgi:hypothetical protein